MSAGQGAVLSGWFLTFITRDSGNTGLQTRVREQEVRAIPCMLTLLSRYTAQGAKALGSSATRKMDQCAQVYGAGFTDPSEQLRGGGLCSCHSLCTLTRPW